MLHDDEGLKASAAKLLNNAISHQKLLDFFKNFEFRFRGLESANTSSESY